jgi:hypothetical protein
LGRQAQCDRVACPPAKTVDAMKSRCQPRAAAVRARPARGATQAQETAQSPHPAARSSRASAQPRQGRPRATSVSDTSAAEVVTSPRRLFPRQLQEPCTRARAALSFERKAAARIWQQGAYVKLCYVAWALLEIPPHR